MTNIFGTKLKNYRLMKDLSQSELASKLGTTKQVISKYENGLRTPKVTVVQEYANKLNINVNYLLDLSETQISVPDDADPNSYNIPLAEVHAGYDGFEIEVTDQLQSIPKDWIHDDIDNYICYRVKGDSCYPLLMDKIDVLLVHKQSSVESGTLAIVVYQEMATVKRVFYDKSDPTWLRLEPINNAYPPITIKGECDVNQTYVVGKVVNMMRTF